MYEFLYVMYASHADVVYVFIRVMYLSGALPAERSQLNSWYAQSKAPSMIQMGERCRTQDITTYCERDVA
jgi:hypothetical protein